MTHDYIELARQLSAVKKRLEASLPYHINLVDAIGADENANSRIMAALLMQHDEARHYEILKSFAKEFFSDTRLAGLIEKPVIVTEQLVRNDKRIDIYIYEPGRYAIILENKVMDAPEQPHQLANYIEGLHNFGFSDEQIFIGYLPRTNETKPSLASWTTRRGWCYEQDFAPRFCNISFRDAILPWLNKQKEAFNEPFLKNAINMYADYLEGQFGFRPNEQFIEMKTKEYITEKLRMTESDVENLQKGMEAINELENLKKDIMRVNREAAVKVLADWLAKAKASFPTLNWEDRSSDSQFPSIDFQVPYDGKPNGFRVFLQIDLAHSINYYGIHFGTGQSLKAADAREMMKPIMDPLGKFNYNIAANMFWEQVSVAEAYGKFERLTVTIIKAFNL